VAGVGVARGRGGWGGGGAWGGEEKRERMGPRWMSPPGFTGRKVGVEAGRGEERGIQQQW